MRKRNIDMDEVETVAYREVIDQEHVSKQIAVQTGLQKLLWRLHSEFQWFLKKHVANR